MYLPAQAPTLLPTASTALGDLGATLRQRRKALGVSAANAAEAAGMSRVTLQRIERGEPSVTMGAYANAMAAVGLQIQVVGDEPKAMPARKEAPRQRIPLAEYAQLNRLAWQMPGIAEVTPEEALGPYERNWRHIDQQQVDGHERALIDMLVGTVGRGHLLV